MSTLSILSYVNTINRRKDNNTSVDSVDTK